MFSSRTLLKAAMPFKASTCGQGVSTTVCNMTRLHLLQMLFIASVFTTGALCHAQSAGSNLSGQVLDPSGAIIPSATLVIRNTADGVVHTIKSNDKGLYSISDLPPGIYTVSVTAAGFSSQIEKSLELTVGGSRQLDVKLAIGDVSQTVEVTAAAADVEADTSVVSATVGQKRIVDLPLNGRDWTQLATLQPGVTNVRSQQTGGVSIGGNRGIRGFGAQLTTNGHSPYENTYRINGINENDFSNGAPGSPLGVNLGVDAIQEFSVVTSAYTAEYGRTSGAVVNAITRSGTNELHGTAFVFDRDKIFDARVFFDAGSIPPFHRVQFGAAAGGPIKKNKAFLFGNYEGIRQSQSTAYNALVPSAAARAGNIHSANGTPIMVTVDPNVIPYFRLYPLPNAGLNSGTFGDTGTYATSNPSGARETFFTMRFDQTFSEKDNLAVTYLYDNGHQSAPDPLGNILSDLLSGRQVATITENHTFGSNLLNVFRLGYNRSHVRVFDPLSASNPAAADTSLGFFPGLYSPQLTITGLTAAYGLGGPRRVEGDLNSYQFDDDVIFTRGRHAFKVGFAFEQLRNLNHSLPQLGGVTFLSLAGFLQNQPYTAQVPTLHTDPVEPTSNIIAEYFQDDWRVAHNLTVSLGLRYEILTIPYDRKNRLGFINTINAPAGSGPCPFVIAPTNIPGCTVPVSKFFQSNPTLHNEEPRVGFSYDPFGTGRTAVRGAFGIYDQLPLPVFYATYSGLTAPYALDQLIVGTLPVGSFPSGIPGLAASSAANRLGHYIDQNPKRDYSMNYNLNVEQSYGKYISTSIGYSGEHSIHGIFNAQDLNQVSPPNVRVVQGRYVWPIGGVQPDANTRNLWLLF